MRETIDVSSCSTVGYGQRGETFTDQQPLIHSSLNSKTCVSAYVHLKEEEVLTGC